MNDNPGGLQGESPLLRELTFAIATVSIGASVSPTISFAQAEWIGDQPVFRKNPDHQDWRDRAYIERRARRWQQRADGQSRYRRDDDQRGLDRRYDEPRYGRREYNDPRYDQRRAYDDRRYDNRSNYGRHSYGRRNDERRYQQAPYPRHTGGGPRLAIVPEAPYAVTLARRERPGTIIIDTEGRRLFYVIAPRDAYVYPLSVGRRGYSWTGTSKVSAVRAWPDWHPPAEMRGHQPWQNTSQHPLDNRDACNDAQFPKNTDSPRGEMALQAES